MSLFPEEGFLNDSPYESESLTAYLDHHLTFNGHWYFSLRYLRK
ncbi:MAG: hypothetical protein QW092_03300 [Candidatus Korarchaeum sp.]